MSIAPPSRQEFTLGECAKLVSTEAWRIRNFVTAANAFGIKAELRPTSDKRSMRYFTGLELAKMAIILQLLEDGFTPKTATEAISLVSDSLVRKWLDAKGETLVLLRMLGTWELLSTKDADRQVNKGHGTGLQNAPGFYLLRVSEVVVGVRRAIYERGTEERATGGQQ